MINSLYLDTTTRKIIIKLYFDTKKRDELIFEDNKYSDAPLIEQIDKILKRNKLEVTKLDQLLVNTGPGYFTSTRLGVSFANALKLANPRIKLIEIQDEINEKKILRSLKSTTNKNLLTPVYLSPPNITKNKL